MEDSYDIVAFSFKFFSLLITPTRGLHIMQAYFKTLREA